jgi:hypothetical protein
VSGNIGRSRLRVNPRLHERRPLGQKSLAGEWGNDSPLGVAWMCSLLAK